MIFLRYFANLRQLLQQKRLVYEFLHRYYLHFVQLIT